MDVFETEKAVVVRVALAGLTNSEVKVSVDGEWLRIHGERTPSEEVAVQRLHQMEIAFGPFERRLRIPVPFEKDQVVASLDAGLLTVRLPKRRRTSRRVEIRREP